MLDKGTKRNKIPNRPLVATTGMPQEWEFREFSGKNLDGMLTHMIRSSIYLGTCLVDIKKKQMRWNIGNILFDTLQMIWSPKCAHTVFGELPVDPYWIFSSPVTMKITVNKKVLLRERKRHTARRVAVASACYSGGGGGGPSAKFFFPVWTCIKPNLVSKFFPFTGGGGSLCENFFSSLNMYQAKSGVKIFSLYRGGGGGCPSVKIFFQSEHVSSQIWCQNFLPLLGGGGVPIWKFFFSSLNMYQAKSGVKKFSL